MKMVTSQLDPWGHKYTNGSAFCNVSQSFDDDFSSSTIIDDSFIALEDSKEYLARLEKKLNKLNESSAKNLSSKSLLASLSATRSHHQHNFLSSTDNFVDSSCQEFQELHLPKAKGILLNDSQTHLSNLVLKVAPEKLALSPEELVQLLAADCLSNHDNIDSCQSQSELITDENIQVTEKLEKQETELMAGSDIVTDGKESRLTEDSIVTRDEVG